MNNDALLSLGLAQYLYRTRSENFWNGILGEKRVHRTITSFDPLFPRTLSWRDGDGIRKSFFAAPFETTGPLRTVRRRIGKISRSMMRI